MINYPNFNIRSKNEIAKRISSNKLPQCAALHFYDTIDRNRLNERNCIMPKLKVFIDTNIVNNPTPIGGLFGNAKRLKCFEKRVDIIIPRIVQDELIEHKRRAFELEKISW